MIIDLQGAHDRHHLAGRRRTRGLEAALERICAEADRVLKVGVNILILSDRRADSAHAPIPALLAVSSGAPPPRARGDATAGGLVVESGEPREVHHFATLIGYGVAAVNL